MSMDIEFYSRTRSSTDLIRSVILDLNQKTTLHKFREFYYHLKFKKQFRDWLWLRVREPKIKILYHYDHLSDLNEENDLDLYLENLGWLNQEISV
jgi:hypothetical protein